MTKTNSTKSSYLALAAAITTKVKELGLPELVTDSSTESGLPENKGHFILTRGDKGAPRIYVSKSGSYADSQVPVPPEDGGLPLPKDNGAIVCRVKVDADTLAMATAHLEGATRRGPRRQPKGEKVVETPVSE